MLDNKVVNKSSSEVPNHSQETTFLLVEHGTGGPDEMIMAKGRKKTVTRGESAVAGIRTPY